MGLAVLKALFVIIKVLKQEATRVKPHRIYSNHSDHYDSEDSVVFGCFGVVHGSAGLQAQPLEPAGAIHIKLQWDGIGYGFDGRHDRTVSPSAFG